MFGKKGKNKSNSGSENMLIVDPVKNQPKKQGNSVPADDSTRAIDLSNIDLGNGKAEKIKFGIGFKLVGVIGFLLSLAVVSIVLLAADQFEKTALLEIRQFNAMTAGAYAGQMDSYFSALSDKMSVGGNILHKKEILDHQVVEKIEKELFEKDQDILTTSVYENQNGNFVPIRQVFNRKYLEDKGVGEEIAEQIRKLRPIDFNKAARRDHLSVYSARTPDGEPLLSLVLPLIAIDNVATHLVVTDVKQDKFLRAFTKGTESGANPGLTDAAIFLVDEEGKILAHQNTKMALNEKSIAEFEIFKEMTKGGGKSANKGAKEFEIAGETLLGSYQKVSGVGWVVSQKPLKQVLAPMRRVIQVSIWLGVIVLSLSFIIGFFFSKTITRPVKRLFRAAQKVAEGDFTVRVKHKGKDELGALASQFGKMCEGLQERDKVKSTFNKFQTKKVAEKLLSGEVHLGGEHRNVTVFFSDIRGFTAMSESLDPEQVVELLNEYMTVMVDIIVQYGGTVDKYIGDAIMAIWGAPTAHDNDTQNAVMACLKMREALIELNKRRMDRGEIRLSFGIGLNTGDALAGVIGSEAKDAEKMEYTVIGDTVNLASRVESLTKEMGADVLISESTLKHMGEDHPFETEQCPLVKVKGKKEKLKIFKVIGHYDASGALQTYPDPYKPKEQAGADKWYVKLSGGKTDGPFLPEELFQMVEDGDITVQNKVMKKGTQDWLDMTDAPFFSEYESGDWKNSDSSIGSTESNDSSEDGQDYDLDDSTSPALMIGGESGEINLDDLNLDNTSAHRENILIADSSNNILNADAKSSSAGAESSENILNADSVTGEVSLPGLQSLDDQAALNSDDDLGFTDPGLASASTNFQQAEVEYEIDPSVEESYLGCKWSIKENSKSIPFGKFDYVTLVKGLVAGEIDLVSTWVRFEKHLPSGVVEIGEWEMLNRCSLFEDVIEAVILAHPEGSELVDHEWDEISASFENPLSPDKDIKSA